MKTTKYFLSMAALALVGATFTGCSSDDNITDQPQQPETKNNVVTQTTTVGFDDATGTTRALDINYTAKTLTKTFAVGDQIALNYRNTSSQPAKAVSKPLTASDISADGKSATFTFELTDPRKSGTVTYIYPAAMASENGYNWDNLNTQDGTLASIASNLDGARGVGIWSGDALPSVTMTNGVAIIAYTLKDETGANDITSTITGMTISDGSHTYNITGKDADGHIYAAIWPTDNANIEYTATDGTKNYTKSVTGKTYETGQFYQVGLRMTEVVDPNQLSGIFSVSSTKKVKFSKGNLRYASGTWSFFDNQYDYYTSYSADAWDKFGWSTSATTYGMNTSTSSSTYSGDFVDWGATIGTGWRTLTSAEWQWMLGPSSSPDPGTNCRTSSTVNGTANARFAKATVKGKPGIIIFPDTYTHPDGVTFPSSINTANAAFTVNSYGATAWSKMITASCVFLPAAGRRSQASVDNAGSYGYYWSSSPGTSSVDYAYGVLFNSGYLGPAGGSNRSYGFSVRLVREVTE